MIIRYCENQMSGHVLAETMSCFGGVLDGCLSPAECVLSPHYDSGLCDCCSEESLHICSSSYIIKVMCEPLINVVH